MVARAKEIGGDEIYLVVGGFHLGKASRQHVKRIVAEFRRMGVEQIAPSHCTGDGARDLFRGAYGEDYHTVGVGWHWQSQAGPTN
jgi:7,8-dihydropterin-6-yl-methyl-4-(beta-D-ribofuranosyl)aminobenzene 5'-phosphate synthase